MLPIITAFADSPDEGRGLARDMRVRWALEEVGQPYDVRLVTFAELRAPEHRARNPFGQIPTFEDGNVALFESGAIILQIAQSHPGLLPDDPAGRARAIMWMVAALSTVEPPIVEREQVAYTERDQPWYAARLPLLETNIRRRLDVLAEWLGERDWLEDRFTAGDLVMVLVLRRLEGMDILQSYPNLSAYIARGTARPAYRRAYAAQRAVFTERHGG